MTKTFRKHVRPALPSATSSAAVVLVLTFATDYLLSHSFKINDPYIADTLAAVLAFLIFLLRSYAMREEIAKIESYQATEYHKRVRVSNAIMSIQHAIEQCDHVADPGHLGCCATLRQQLLIVKAVVGKSPDSTIIHGTRASAAAVGA